MEGPFVVEIASTGPAGCPKDQVAEIAVCRIDGSDFDTVYAQTVAIDPRDLGKDPLDYLSDQYGIGTGDLYTGMPIEDVVEDVQGILFGNECTSYDVGNVFGRYLSFEPWDATGNVSLLPSLCARLPRELKGKPWEEHLRLAEAYVSLCPGDPAGVGEGMRPIHLAQMASSVLLALKGQGLYRAPEGHPHRTGAEKDVGQHAQVHQDVDDPHRDGQYNGEYEDGQADRRDEHQQADEGDEQEPGPAHVHLADAQQTHQP